MVATSNRTAADLEKIIIIIIMGQLRAVSMVTLDTAEVNPDIYTYRGILF